MANEGQYPKAFEDIQFASEANAFNAHGTGDGSDHANVASNTTNTAKVTGTLYWSCTGVNFKAKTPDTGDIIYSQGKLTVTVAVSLYASVHIPHGAVITSFIGYGNAGTSDELISLGKWNTSTGTLTAVMAQVNFGTEDTSITNATIDNNTYSYWIFTSLMSGADEVRGARITYTL